jgi:uncharacterized protein with NAD-binding domain and iron-sulfur cluster
MPEARKRSVAIIGGGCAAMAAAWDLTSPDNKAPCDVTIFQMGGRLGGKGASSRNSAFGDRIEEHGLHLWLGYYENAFRMVRTCFTELKQRAPSDPELKQHLESQPFNNWDWLAAFERASLVGLADDSTGDWLPWIARFPEYVPRSENGVTGLYEWADGTKMPGVHVVDDENRAYPGEEPAVRHGNCEDGDATCLEQPNVAFFLTHALRELQAFVESFESRIAQLGVKVSGPSLAADPDEVLSQALNLNPVPVEEDDGDDAPPDILGVLRIIRLTFLVPTIQAFATTARILEGPIPHVRNRVVAMLDRYIDEMREKIETIVQSDTPARRLWELIDLLAANIRGLIAAGLEGHDDFSSLDEWNYEDWLRMNRIAERTLRNPIVRGAHDLGFAYRGGDPRDPQIAAGQAINAACRFFFMYKGSLFWRMKAGMGDVVFAPMYLALRNRGVKFRFFHQLKEIEVDDAGASVTGLKFWRQVKLRETDRGAQTNYQPLVPITGQRMSGWRDKPDESQFRHTADLRARYERAVTGQDEKAYVNFESVWCNWEHGDHVFATVGEERHQDPRESSWVGHYDDVIVTVPVAALERVSKKLSAAPNEAGRRWGSMLQNIGTVATQSMQLWVNRTTRELGWMHGQVSFSAFVHPFDTWADLTQLIKVENQGDAKGVHYFCSVLSERDVPAADRDGPATDTDPRDIVTALKAVKAAVTENAKRFLDEWIFQLWPLASDRYPNVFRWPFLLAPKNEYGVERLNSQYLVANVDPSERYTQSLPGTTKYRIRPDDTGFKHLFIAGDWTECGLNFGCVEAAVISGRLASSAITHFPDTRLIPGYFRPEKRVVATKGGG